MQNEHRFTRAIDADVHIDDQTKLISQPYIQPIFQCTHDYLQLNLYLKKTSISADFQKFLLNALKFDWLPAAQPWSTLIYGIMMG